VHSVKERPTESRVARRRAAPAARRRLLLLSFLSLLVVMAGVLANLGPLQHLFEAKTRMEKTTANVAGLQAKKDTLQAELAKLSEAAYLETLARGELAYVRPGEELYIVTEADPSSERGSSGSQLGLGVISCSDSSTSDELGALTATPSPTARPGFFERILQAITEVF